jgi:acylphosphatase
MDEPGKYWRVSKCIKEKDRMAFYRVSHLFREGMDSHAAKMRLTGWIKNIKNLISNDPSHTKLAPKFQKQLKKEIARAKKWKKMLQHSSDAAFVDIAALKSHPKSNYRMYKGIPQTCRSLVWLSLIIGRLPDQNQLDFYRVSRCLHILPCSIVFLAVRLRIY